MTMAGLTKLVAHYYPISTAFQFCIRLNKAENIYRLWFGTVNYHQPNESKAKRCHLSNTLSIESLYQNGSIERKMHTKFPIKYPKR